MMGLDRCAACNVAVDVRFVPSTKGIGFKIPPGAIVGNVVIPTGQLFEGARVAAVWCSAACRAKELRSVENEKIG